MPDCTALFAETSSESGQNQLAIAEVLLSMSNHTLKFDVSVCQIPSSQAELLDSLPGTQLLAVPITHLGYLTKQCTVVQDGSHRTLLSM